MTQDQCPSTRQDRPVDVTARVGTPSGRGYWRSVDEFSQTGAFREFVEREFPGGASELLDTSRRDFVKLMGASVALAGAATIPGCRRPDHKILTYSADVPENIVPGKPLFYATSMPLPGGGAEGLLVETHEGRPTKVEGNPLHPNNRGRCSPHAMAATLTIYDPDRLMYPVYDNPARGRVDATWDDFKTWSREH
ncbi:MAG: TAT-variant-translocated molybdopterin oxidoreductase, partial [Phycisphaerales bacterium JB041]